MQVVAFSPTRASTTWRWRIVNYAGEVLAESQATFPTIAVALADGAKHAARMNMVDLSTRPSTHRSTTHLRRPATKPPTPPASP